MTCEKTRRPAEFLQDRAPSLEDFHTWGFADALEFVYRAVRRDLNFGLARRSPRIRRDFDLRGASHPCLRSLVAICSARASLFPPHPFCRALPGLRVGRRMRRYPPAALMRFRLRRWPQWLRGSSCFSTLAGGSLSAMATTRRRIWASATAREILPRQATSNLRR